MFHKIFFQMMGDMFRRKEFFSVLTASLLIFLGTVVANMAGFWGLDRDSLYPAWCYWGAQSSQVNARFTSSGVYLVIFLLPFLVSLAYSYSYFDGQKSGMLKFQITRTSRAFYFGSAMLTAFCGSFLIIFIPMVLSLVLCCIAYPLSTLQIPASSPIVDEYVNDVFLFRSLYINHPYLHHLIYSVILSLAAGFLGMLPLSLSFFFRKNRFLVLTIPGIVWLVLWLSSQMMENGPNVLLLLSLDPAFSARISDFAAFYFFLLLVNLVSAGCKLRLVKDEL